LLTADYYDEDAEEDEVEEEEDLLFELDEEDEDEEVDLYPLPFSSGKSQLLYRVSSFNSQYHFEVVGTADDPTSFLHFLHRAQVTYNIN